MIKPANADLANRTRHSACTRPAGGFEMCNVKVRSLAIACIFSAIIASPDLHAQDNPQFWSAIGATGIADESSTSLVSFSDTGSVSIKSSVASATAQLRYPVLPVGELAKDQSTRPNASLCLDVDYRDTGAGSRVIVSLKSVDGEEGTVTHLTFDSDSKPATGTDYLFDHVCGAVNSDGSEMFQYNTLARAYYVDVRLVKSASGANPGVKKIMLTDTRFETP
jgi:hypothetical protein